MKKALFILLMALPLLHCCTLLEEDMPLKNESAEEVEGKVLVRFSVTLPEADVPMTKALGDTPAGDLTDMYIAVFGRSGYLKEYVSATMVPATLNGSLTGNDNRYEFTALLTLSENSERHIHFLGNGPTSLDYGYENELLDVLMSPVGKGGYWQSFVVPGIKAKRDANGNMIGEETTIIDGQTVYLGTGTFQIADETAAYFEDVPLIRNFAKIVVNDGDDCHFRTISFAAVNRSTQGSMAPYYSGGFIYGYENKSYTDLENMGYPAKLPLDAEFDNTVPAASHFVSPNSYDDVAAAGSSYFMYERPIPNDSQQPTVVIIYGEFTDPDTEDGSDDSGYYFYKVDLMENGVYYPIYRNFKYQILIERILKPGADSPADALLSMGSGDVSADISTQNITDISDGTSRILVSYMNKTLIRQYPYVDNEETVTLSLLYKFIPDVSVDTDQNGEPDINNNLVDNGPVTISLQNVNGKDVITNYEVADHDVDGWREITISTIAPTSNVLSQYIRISGQVNGNNPIYRNVTFTMLSKQDMTVTCVPSKVEEGVGKFVEVDIGIPKNLPSSMFPLIFNLESDGLSLTPDNTKANNNLPVESGVSTISGNTNTTFHYVRTLSEAEYLSLGASSSTNTVTVPCYFKTNKVNSASTVYVVDEGGFFNAANDSFTNYVMKSFTNLSFTSGVSTTAQTPAPFRFQMNSSYPLPPKVYFKFTGVKPTLGAGLSLINNTSDPYNGWYYYEPANTDVDALKGYTPTINLATEGTSGKASVTIEADEYLQAYLSASPRPVTSLTLNKTSLTLHPNGSERLNATINPANHTDDVIWSSSNTSVARVASDGTVTAVALGTAVITVRAGNYTAQCTVSVTKAVFTNLGFYSAARANASISTIAVGTNQGLYFRFDYESGYTGYPVTFRLTGLTKADDESRLVANDDGSFTFTPTDNNTSQYVHLKTTTRFSHGYVHIDCDEYEAVASQRITRPSFNIPTGALNLEDGPMSVANYWNWTLYSYPDNSFSTEMGTSSISRTLSGIYRNGGTLAINPASFSNPDENTIVYFALKRNNNTTYYATATYAQVYEASTSNRLTLTFSTTAP